MGNKKLSEHKAEQPYAPDRRDIFTDHDRTVFLNPFQAANPGATSSEILEAWHSLNGIREISENKIHPAKRLSGRALAATVRV